MRDLFNKAAHYTMDYILQGGEEDGIEGTFERSLACLEVAGKKTTVVRWTRRSASSKALRRLTATIPLRQVL